MILSSLKELRMNVLFIFQANYQITKKAYFSKLYFFNPTAKSKSVKSKFVPLNSPPNHINLCQKLNQKKFY
jgi:hypothetical protein